MALSHAVPDKLSVGNSKAGATEEAGFEWGDVDTVALGVRDLCP